LAQSYHTGFRGDARWIGFGLVPVAPSAGAGSSAAAEQPAGACASAGGGSDSNRGEAAASDVLLALSSGGYAYVVTHASRMDMTRVGGAAVAAVAEEA
jgi:hypothetical protein